METYGKILLIAMPAFLALVLIEKFYGWLRGNDTVTNMDMVSSLSSGVTNVTKDVLGLSVVIMSYGWLVDHLAIYRIGNGFLTYLVAFLALDFSGYWVHRIEHRYNLFWNNHIIHHSSEEFNLACALRQSISTFFSIFTFFLLPAALLGVPEQVIAVIAPIHLFAQFWYHTRHIDKMGFLEKVIVTPSHHRVHHAINPEYIDRNFSQIFIFWDKMFGTFREECHDIRPVYGITRPARTWNPIKINFQHLSLLIKDAWRARDWRDKLRIWLMPTGWRPEDVEKRYPVQKIADLKDFEKYAPQASKAMHFFAWFQLSALLLLICYLFGNIAEIGKPDIFIYGLFIFLMVYAYTDLMDRNASSVIVEGLKCSLGLYIILSSGDWFGISSHFKLGGKAVAMYLLVSWLITIVFAYRNRREDESARYQAFA